MIQADMFKMFRMKWIKICTLFMLLVATMMIVMQNTAMDYEVGLDRVIFLPMTMYGIAASVLVSMVCGSDYEGGFIRNKVFSGNRKGSIYFSNQLANWAGGAAMYLVTFAFTLTIGLGMFERNVSFGEIGNFFVLGFLASMVYISIFCMLAMLIGNKATAAVTCMVLAFAMLFVGMYSNTFFIQNDSGSLMQEILFDLNPTGQIAQVSAMKCLNPVRYVLIDIGWIIITNVVGIYIFQHRELK